MALRTTRWSPDTCGCTIDLQWDDSVPAAARVHTPTAALPCPAHAGGPVAVHAAVLKENVGKNRSVAALVAAAPGLTPEDVAWEITPGRKVRVRSRKGLTPAQRVEARAALLQLAGEGVPVDVDQPVD